MIRKNKAILIGLWTQAVHSSVRLIVANHLAAVVLDPVVEPEAIDLGESGYILTPQDPFIGVSLSTQCTLCLADGLRMCMGLAFVGESNGEESSTLLLRLLRRLKMLLLRIDIDSGDAHIGAIHPGVKYDEVTLPLERCLAEKSRGAGLSFLVNDEVRDWKACFSATISSTADLNDIVRCRSIATLEGFLGGIPMPRDGIAFLGDCGIELLRSKSVSISITMPSEEIGFSYGIPEPRSRKRGTRWYCL